MVFARSSKDTSSSAVTEPNRMPTPRTDATVSVSSTAGSR
ncbi:Uncharacterised protein [Mycobacteroides abscessus subsp. abscessus]|nr:Uncharacterised protein [Mycobacteroides abscessus subsp. abscessus]